MLREIAEAARALTGARYPVITTVDATGQLEDAVLCGFSPEEERQVVAWGGAPARQGEQGRVDGPANVPRVRSARPVRPASRPRGRLEEVEAAPRERLPACLLGEHAVIGAIEFDEPLAERDRRAGPQEAFDEVAPAERDTVGADGGLQRSAMRW